MSIFFGGNGRDEASDMPEVIIESGPRQRRRLDPTQMLTLVLSLVFAGLVSWFGQSAQVQANTRAIADTREHVGELQKAKEQAATDSARLTERMEGLVKRLDEVTAKLERLAER